MEDGSATAVENILVQSGSLGFYQKRLFFCSCFLQALTVSALIYASHCRPDITPPSSPTSTNGARVHHSKCRSRSDVREDLIPGGNETSSTEYPARNSSGDGLGRTDRTVATGGVVTQSSLTASSPGVSSDYGSVSGAQFDVSTSSAERDDDPLSVSATNASSQHRHDDHGVTGKTSVKVTPSDASVKETSSDAVTPTLSSNVYASQTGFYPISPGTESQREYVNDDNGVFDSSTGESVRELALSSSGLGSTKEKRESSRVKDETTDGTANGVSSSDSVSDRSTDSADVTVSRTEDNDCEDEDDGEGPLHYLALTYLPAPEWLGDVNNEQLIQYNAYCQAVGAMVGAALGAMGADQAGRRKPLYVYFPLMLIAHCLSGFAVSWTMLAVFRFLVGMFAGACAVVSLVFPLEFIGTEWRDACVCSGIWVVGVVLISLELLVTRHWRYLAFISGGIGLPLIGTYFIASESARWLLCHQKFSDAEATLKEIISCNSTSVPDFLSLFDKSRASVVTNMHHKRYTYLDLFHSLEMAKWTVALVYTCLVGSSVYFCLLAKVKAMTGNAYLDNSLPFVIDLPLGWSAIVVNRCLGRRWCLFLYAVASGLALLSVLVLHMTGNLSNMPSMLTGMAVFGKIGVTASLGLVFVIAVEMYPTVVRCMGVAVGVIAVTGGSLLAETLLFLEAYHYTVPFVVFGAMMASVGFAGLLFPETLQRPLPNILPCRHRTIPLHEGVRLVTNPWDAL